MKALMRNSRKVGDISLTDIPIPEPKGSQVLAKVAYAGICGSDIDIINARNTIYKPPVVQGHEFSAVVSQVGENVTSFLVGDKIVSETTFEKCGKCKPCVDGNYHLCEHKEIVGWTENGGFAEYVLLNSQYIHKLDDNADLLGAALIEPMAIAAEAVHIKGELQAGESIAVIGPGATGILSVLLAKEMGAKNVYFIGRKTSLPIRFKIAEQLSIEHCINSSEVDPIEYILDHNKGINLDMVVDTTGNINGFNLAMELVKRNGRIIEIGSIPTDEVFPWPKAAFKALDLKIVFSSSHKAWEKSVSIFNNSKIEFRKIITHIKYLQEYKEAFDLADNSKKSFKVVFKP